MRDHLLWDDRVVWCGHREPRFAFVGGQHPAAGVHCIDCMSEHVDRHSWTVEHECDVCKMTVLTISAYIERLVGMVEVYDRRSRRALMIGEITIESLGVCGSCLETAGIAA